MNSLRKLMDCGQSCWLDNLTRGQIRSGELKELVTGNGVRGVTSNPAIFNNAISKGNDYDEQIAQLVTENRSVLEIYEALVVKDVRDACDVLRSVYDDSEQADGFVSLEVSPYLAHDTEATLEEARRLFHAVDRPNCMIKIPGTSRGLPAIEQCLYEGVNINVTLLFSVQSYEEVAQTYVRALQRRAVEGKPLKTVASVASFFLSRIDVLGDQLLGHLMIPAAADAGSPRPERLLGRAAVANAIIAYESFKRIFSGDEWESLAAQGARVQRPLWASTSTKDPLYSDVAYVAPLIGQHTVNTMPEETIAAFSDHGLCRANTVEEGLAEARRTLGELAEAGIDIDLVTRQLVNEGIQKFIDPFNKLLKTLALKRERLLREVTQHQSIAAGASKGGVASAQASLDAKQYTRRLFARDPYLWTFRPEEAEAIRNRLGWLGCPEDFSGRVEEIVRFAEEVRDDGIESVVLLGMGGSSLCPEVCRETFGRQQGWPELVVLDNTDPAAIKRVKSAIDPARSLFVVASKSGTTTETISFYRYFLALLQKQLDAGAGRHFVAITDPGTPLAEEARREGFRRIFENPPDIGGRYAALSYFGLAPMALAGIDIAKILQSAQRMHASCGPFIPAEANPGVSLGILLAMNRRLGRDKVTFLLSPAVQSFGLWAEQLLAESTGKQGTGLVPVEGEEPDRPDAYGSDRLFVSIALRGDEFRKAGRRLEALEKAGHPVVRIELADKFALGGEFMRWEFATVTAAAILGVNPFDEPNVAESKRNTQKLLDGWSGKAPAGAALPLFEEDGMSVFCEDIARLFPGEKPQSISELLAGFARGSERSGYVAILPYFAETPARRRKLQALRTRMRERAGTAVTVGYGPRYLHSTGQLHKGGPGNGRFLILTWGAPGGLRIPGKSFDFATLQRAQALGDCRALSDKGRAVIRVHLGRSVDKSLKKLADMLA